MEQPRPLRRRRRSSRRGAGPPAGPGTVAETETPTTDPSTTTAPTTAAATARADGVTGGVSSGEPRPEDADGAGTSSPATPGEATSPDTPPVAVTVVANAAFAAATGLDDSLSGATAPGMPHTFAGSPATAAATGPGHPPELGRPSGEGPRRTYRTPREDQSERSLRALVTTRSTQVSPTAAMRAREVAVPMAADLLAAEADMVVVRRHYVPPTALAAAGRRRDRSERRPSGAGQSGGTQTGNTQAQNTHSPGGDQSSGQHQGDSPTDRTAGHPGD